MSGYKGNTWANNLQKLTFNATAIANIADNAATSPLTNLYLSLHTADPASSGNQGTNETVYTNYVRLAVARTSGGWTVSTNSSTNAATAAFAQCGATGATITHVGIGTASSGAGILLYAGPLTSSLIVNNGITPQFAASGLTVTES
jgi:hypothetical protein